MSVMMNMKNIVVASNPFGFGPTGNAIPLLKALERRFAKCSGTSIYFIGSQDCQKIVPNIDRVKRIVLDERDVSSLSCFLSGLDGETIAIGVQNRFIIEAADGIVCRTVFVDALAWLWPKIPISHLAADEVFWMRFPGILEKRHQYRNFSNIHIIGGMYEVVQRNPSSYQGKILICLGGGFNPLRKGIQEKYLMLVSEILLKSKFSSSKADIATGSEAANFLRRRLRYDGRYNVETLMHGKFLDRLSNASRFVSVGGQSSTMESILSGVPLSFFIPSNLSQMILQEKLADEVTSDLLWWKEDLSVPLGEVVYISEREFLDRMEIASERILADIAAVQRMASRFDSELSGLPCDISGTGKWIGSDGAESMADKIAEWL